MKTINDYSTTHQPSILAIDIETTCLDPAEGEILEVYIKKVNYQLFEQEEFHVILDTDPPENTPDNVMQIHMDNGLLYETPTGVLLDIENYLLQFEKIIFLGNSVNFDKSWIEYHIPKIKDRLHYRVIDTSSFITLCPELLNILPPKPKNHRAKDDLNYSLHIARTFRDMMKLPVYWM